MPRTACIRIFMRPRACEREMNIFKKLFSVSSNVAINFEFTSFLLSHMGVIYDSHLLAAGVFCAWDIELLALFLCVIPKVNKFSNPFSSR